MRVLPNVLVALAIWVAIMAGAASAQDIWGEVVRESEERVGTTPARAGDRAAQEVLVRSILADGLTRDEAVELALRNNSQLQVAFDELGIAAADLDQAGLYTNPSLDAVLRFPSGEGGTNLEAELSFVLSDIWLVPIRRSLGQARLEQVTAQVISDVLNTAADAKQAYDHCLVLDSLLAQTGEIASTVRKWRDQVHERYEHGYSSQLDLSMADAAAAEMDVDLEVTEAERRIALARLGRLLGLTAEHDLVVVGSLPDVPSELPDLDEVTRRALAERPDLQAARAGLLAADRALLLERHSRWRHVAVGPAYAHEPDGEDLWGLVLQFDLPVFDANRAQRRRAAAELTQAQNQVHAVESLVREEVATAWERLALATSKERGVRDQILPARRRAFEHAQKYWREMQLNTLYMLEAQREFAEAKRQHVAALGEVQRAHVELEFALGGKLALGQPPGRAGD